MRPLELELVAFRSYDAARVDWRPHDLVAVSYTHLTLPTNREV